ncbi:MAG: EFR1 family ferrodoxin [Duncaniella sp.]|nr:EFR1 family ferrodoxin [Muribaculum sp.]MCM1255518.1 EFR1 family ferrodoxin [Duncaniella sp.]
MIIWFSGTGNSYYVASQLATHLGEKMIHMNPEVLSSGSISIESTERIIWVFPVYSWGIPPFVLNIIHKISINGIKPATPHHLVLTCGDDTGLTAENWRKELRKRGWRTMSAFSVQMPNNYVCMKGFDIDSPDIVNDKLQKAPQRIAEIAKSIIKGETTTDTVKGRFAWIKSRVIYPWFVHNAMSPKAFHHTSDCISCSKCASICPLNNITMVSTGNQLKTPLWGINCAMCLGCYHICPRHAVEYGDKTKNKGQYINPEFHVNKN